MLYRIEVREPMSNWRGYVQALALSPEGDFARDHIGGAITFCDTPDCDFENCTQGHDVVFYYTTIAWEQAQDDGLTQAIYRASQEFNFEARVLRAPEDAAIWADDFQATLVRGTHTQVSVISDISEYAD